MLGRAADHILTPKQLRSADQHQPLRHQPKAGREMADGKVQPPLLGGPALGKQLTEPTGLRFSRADDPDFLIPADVFELFSDTVEHTGKPLHALNRKLSGSFEARSGHARERHRRPAVDSRKNILGL